MSVNKEGLWKEKVGEYRKENHCGLLVWGRASGPAVLVLRIETLGCPASRVPGMDCMGPLAITRHFLMRQED